MGHIQSDFRDFRGRRDLQERPYRLISDAVPEADETIVLEAYDVSGPGVALAGNANVLRSAAGSSTMTAPATSALFSSRTR